MSRSLFAIAITISLAWAQPGRAEDEPNPDLARAMCKLAQEHVDAGEYAKAEKLFREALEIDEEAFGKDSREAARDLSDLGLVYLSQGQYLEAEKLYKQALSMVEAKVGGRHPDVATCLNNLAFLYRNEGRWDEAKPLVERALEIRGLTLGKDHPAVARNLAILADIESNQKHWADAEQMLRRAIAIDKNALDWTHPDIAANLRDLAAVQANQGHWSAVESTSVELLTIDSKTKAPDAVHASDLDLLSKALYAQDKHTDAERVAEKAKAIKQRLPGSLGYKDSLSAPNAVPPQSTPARPIRDKWALVVGISTFKDPSMNLKFAAKDATDFRNFLVHEAHFQPDHVKLLTDANATRQNIVDNLGDKWLKQVVHPDDLVVVFVSSHGSSAKQEFGQSNFLVPYEGNLENIAFNGIPMQWLTAGIKDMVRSDRVLLVLDVCHGGAVAEGAKGISRGDIAFDPATIGAGDGQLVIASSRADQISWESKKYANSVFTRHLLDGLRKSGDRTRIQEAFSFMKERVQEEVLRDRAHLQTPVLITKWWQGGDIVLAAPPATPRTGSISQALTDTPDPRTSK